MEQKEKVTTLINMGFSVDEALALAAGNYRTVPDPQPASEHQEPEQKEPEEKPEDKKPEVPDFSEQIRQLNDTVEKLKNSLIQQNINNTVQPNVQSTDDILALMLEPHKPKGV